MIFNLWVSQPVWSGHAKLAVLRTKRKRVDRVQRRVKLFYA